MGYSYLKEIFMPWARERLREAYWNNKWEKSNITYSARNNKPYDVRSFISYPSVILKDLIIDIEETDTEDEKVLKVINYVFKNIKYKTDEGEYWAYPEDTYYKGFGDCEDHACLVISILRNLGIPAYRLKVCCGFAYIKHLNQVVGHAYPIFLNSKNEWVSLDTTFYPDLTTLPSERMQAKDLEYYQNIWFCFNDVFSFSPKEVDIDNKRLRELNKDAKKNTSRPALKSRRAS